MLRCVVEVKCVNCTYYSSVDLLLKDSGHFSVGL